MIDPVSGEHVNDRPARGPSTTRLPLLLPGSLSDEQLTVYEAVTGGPRGSGRTAPSWPDDSPDSPDSPDSAVTEPPFGLADESGRLLGPFNAMLYSPSVGLPLQDLGAALRFRTAFTRREREIATLVVAAHLRSDFEWYAHERIGRRAGLADGEMDALREGRAPMLGDVRERVVYEATRQLVAEGDLGDAVFTEAATTLGRAAVVELVTLVGYYRALALQLRVFRVGVPDGEPAPEWPAAGGLPEDGHE
ncbi:carboxymuconolactone decarboxylase family protein [Actinomadura soli]|uniref:Carboxymuconolactone decarboxylase family protein n=1 Tax=Actinomadura soli TaxID=2508997 RepID=A0A5C4JK84_9ACTN|nr:carboxymuconolactone decarboxylase family protein [Actinomadura soli]TMR07519.1 carboxymuconolactone decarboxylase family protein [Actinomadura soli]